LMFCADLAEVLVEFSGRLGGFWLLRNVVSQSVASGTGGLNRNEARHDLNSSTPIPTAFVRLDRLDNY
jgi:hypothetical protein